MESTGELPPWSPEIDRRVWIKDLRKQLKVSQTRLGKLVGASRDTERNWEGSAPEGPGFSYTRRLAIVAPPRHLAKFLGPHALAALCLELKENPTGIDVAEPPEWRMRAATLVARLALLSDGARWTALTRFSDAIKDESTARSGQDLRLVGKQRHGNETFGPAFAESQRRADKSINSIRNSRASTPTAPKGPPRRRQRKT